MKATLMTGAIA